jgi:hypothetical protein
MKAVPDTTEREKAGLAVADGRYDQGCGPIEFSGEREREASFPDVLRVFRRIEVDLHHLIVYTNKWTVNLIRKVLDHETDCTAQLRYRRRSQSQKLQIAIDVRFMFPYKDCVHNWLPCSIRIQPVPGRGSKPNAPVRRHWS